MKKLKYDDFHLSTEESFAIFALTDLGRCITWDDYLEFNAAPVENRDQLKTYSQRLNEDPIRGDKNPLVMEYLEYIKRRGFVSSGAYINRRIYEKFLDVKSFCDLCIRHS